MVRYPAAKAPAWYLMLEPDDRARYRFDRRARGAGDRLGDAGDGRRSGPPRNHADFAVCGRANTGDNAMSYGQPGIFTQMAIAPMMPNDPERFAAIAEQAADRVIVDTYFDGDGAKGRRSRALGIGRIVQSDSVIAIGSGRGQKRRY